MASSVMFSCGILIFLLCLFTYINCQSTLGLRKGEACQARGRKSGYCQLLKDCPQIGDFRRTRPRICSFEGIQPIVCCPQQGNNNNNNAALIASNGNAKRSCLLYVTAHCFELIRVRRKVEFHRVVVGGRNAKPKVHKAMVLVGYGASDAKSWNCGGSLISEKWVLSAAHCSNPRGQGPAQWARVGDLDISSTNEDARPQDKSIVQRIVHPNYKEPLIYHDIALFKLDSDVVLNNWVQPICLHTSNDIPAEKATVTGWGRLDFVGEVSPHLQEAEITLVDGAQCRRSYAEFTDNKIPRGIDAQTMVCAGEREGGKDACSGDSGGPLVIAVDGRCIKSQIGITSFGRDCGLPNIPGVYTKVSYYVPWIESIVWPE